MIRDRAPNFPDWHSMNVLALVCSAVNSAYVDLIKVKLVAGLKNDGERVAPQKIISL